jgi:hypothetical protein
LQQLDHHARELEIVIDEQNTDAVVGWKRHGDAV